jgi:hypothetical protein
MGFRVLSAWPFTYTPPTRNLVRWPCSSYAGSSRALIVVALKSATSSSTNSSQSSRAFHIASTHAVRAISR